MDQQIPCEICGESFPLFQLNEHELCCQGSSNKTTTTKGYDPQMSDYVPNNVSQNSNYKITSGFDENINENNNFTDDGYDNNNNKNNYDNDSDSDDSSVWDWGDDDKNNKKNKKNSNDNKPNTYNDNFNTSNNSNTKYNQNNNSNYTDDIYNRDYEIKDEEYMNQKIFMDEIQQSNKRNNNNNTHFDDENIFNDNDNDNYNDNNNYDNSNKFNHNKYDIDNNYNNNNNKDDRTLTIVAIGKTGSGKSTLLNRFRGDKSPKGDKGPFVARGGGKSVTQHVQSSTKKFNFDQNELKYYNDILCTLIDTPGLADSGGNEEKLVNEVRRFFQQVCTGVNAFIITFNVTDVRYDTNIQNLLHLLTELFGKKFWHHVMLVFTRHDSYSNEKIHNDEYRDCMLEYPSRIKKQFNLHFEICSTGCGKNNYIKAIQDILKFSKSRGIFQCKYMKSWEQAGGIGNPLQRKERENKLMLAMSNQEKKYEKELKKLKNQLQLQLNNQKKEKESWIKELRQIQGSNQMIKQLEREQKKKNRELQDQIRDLQNRSNNNSNNRSGNSIVDTVLSPFLGGFTHFLSEKLFNNKKNDNDNGTCLIM